MTWQTTYFIPWEEAGIIATFDASDKVTRVGTDTTGAWYKSMMQYVDIRNEAPPHVEAPLWEVETHYYGDGQHSYTLYRCPVCHARYMSPTDYCPHCGKPLNRTEGRDGD